MRITQRPDNGVYMLDYVDDAGARRRLSLGTRDKTEAERRAREVIAGRDGRAFRAWTLADALEDTEARVWAGQKSARERGLQVRRLVREYGSIPLEAATYDWLCERVGEWQKDGRSNATINRYLSTIRKAMAEAHKRGRLAAIPPMPTLSEPAGKLRWLTTAEEERLMYGGRELWSGPDYVAMRSFICWQIDTGARLGETLRDSTTVEGRTATFVGNKNGDTRSIPLTLRAQCAWPHVPREWGSDGLIRRFTRLRDSLEMPDVSIHTLRHTCASRLVQGGLDIYRVQRWLGHKTITMTMRYAHLAPTSLDSGADILAEAIGARSELRAVQ